jgi:hypothetical protein
MPSLYREMELGLRKLRLRLKRKEIFYFFFIESTLNKQLPKVNVPIVKAYINQLKKVYADADETEGDESGELPDAFKKWKR